MSYAIIINKGYKQNQLNLIYRHIERKNANYTNKEIDITKSKNNYHIKNCEETYMKEVKKVLERNNITPHYTKNMNIVCELLVTSDKTFFDTVGEDETKRYFKTAYDFISTINGMGEEFIISSMVHLDETVPHMHLIYMPVINTLNTKSGKEELKLSSTIFWSGRDCYSRLQDNFYKYITDHGFQFDRRNESKMKHFSMEELKKITKYREMRQELEELKSEKQELLVDNEYLNDYIDKALDCVSILFDFPRENLERIVDDYVEKIDER